MERTLGITCSNLVIVRLAFASSGSDSESVRDDFDEEVILVFWETGLFLSVSAIPKH
jgi:hypothetical protein